MKYEKILEELSYKAAELAEEWTRMETTIESQIRDIDLLRAENDKLNVSKQKLHLEVMQDSFIKYKMLKMAAVTLTELFNSQIEKY